MYTIKQASRLTGVSESLLRAWERRYEVVVPARNESGYRVYDDATLAAISTMRRLVDDGWSPAEAARAVRSGTAPAMSVPDRREVSDQADQANAATHMQLFLSSAARMDTAGIEESLDKGFSLGSFEHVVDSWLFPALEALGEGWALGEIDVAGEHAASHAVQRRLAAAFEAAGRSSRGATVVVGLPPGSQHDLGALAFATAIRRRGLNVLYLGADVPESSWEAAVRGSSARAAVLSVVTPEDRATATAVVERLLAADPRPVVCAGGTSGADLATGCHTLAPDIGVAARELDDLTRDAAR
ncbi:MerR family transcriptional regulator [Nocardioides piscis]|uniref:MerR family transcriptional regulator n=1 Tax=Nocardioides piscis TaxID=2714938 RepID=A0A6G7YH24_9ACTN|nr:MerR family transcriptional regulator [Nocardioides piscis]QIK76112.1 MerR family transcriptional regulator [Nocardioides piscis]